ncbi:limonene-1,2-epoxide hydrolase family protein [Nocardia arizonensis]|uniref:limonene-1,2-epoxide hydrolase family protein n=1 Tax=Nocardia arizonensis TaxID=1141647 RepID=UPI0006D16BE2|nr:limonene-1,2-epoxide hydrolase family protein [Nocardia arizonensis]
MTEELKQDSTTTVREFLSALELGATGEALGLLDPDIVWKNTGLPDVRGLDRVGRALRGLDRDGLGFAVDIHHIAADGADIVLTDRTDHLRFGPVRISFWVTGTFRLREGRIVLWHDHFSFENFFKGALVGLFRAVFDRSGAHRL